MEKKLFIATKNMGKMAEYERLLEPLGFELFSLADLDIGEIEETEDTFEGNARIKARAVRALTKEMILADDSGLMVDALDGKPGIHSKRFSKEATDEANNQRLLKTMENESERSAKFVAVICLYLKNGEMRMFRGECHGYIHTACEGTNGFGYDPLFIPLNYTNTLAELGPEVKNKISHRKKAIDKLLSYIEHL